jgi:membrane dipeptidase
MNIRGQAGGVGARGEDLLRSSILWDNHGCMPLRTDDGFLPQLERYRQAGVNIVSLNIGFADISILDHVRVLSFMRRWLSQRSEAYCLVSKVEDVLRCKTDGRLGLVFDIEGMCPVQDDISLVQTFYELGVRWMLIAYNRNNKAGGGCLDADSGLTDTGRAIIDEMERVGMVLCLSHAGARTVTDALEYVRNPPIFSHSNPYGDHPHPRNVRDDLIRACARKGGVFGLSGIGSFLGSGADLVDRLVQQIRYVVDLVGPDHVGLGLDYVFDVSELEAYLRSKPSLFAPNSLSVAQRGTIEPEAVAEIVERLLKSNLTENQVRGILGQNWLRVARAVWR